MSERERERVSERERERERERKRGGEKNSSIFILTSGDFFLRLLVASDLIS